MTTTITIDDLARQLDPVGVEEVAQRLGVERQTVSQWRWRNKLPEPRWTISNRPAWAWQDIAAWARDTGRLNDQPGVVQCSSCGGEAPWDIDAWTCRDCGDEWYPDDLGTA